MPTGLPTVLEIVETDLRPVFLHEATGFTRWLFQPGNLAWLGRAVGMELEPEAAELTTGTFRLDILARDAATDERVVIENQFARSDHDHLGKTLSYLAATGAKTAIWLAEAFADEHRKALEWLNDSTPPEVGFWAVVPRMLRIGDGPPGLRFEVIVRPNATVKAVRSTERALDPAILDLRERYWAIFRDLLSQDCEMTQVTTRYGGRLGHLTLFPDSRFERIIPRVNILAYLTLSGGKRFARTAPRPDPDETPPEWSEKAKEQRRRCETDAQAILTGDWDSEAGLRDIAARHLASVKAALQITSQIFEPEAAATELP